MSITTINPQQTELGDICSRTEDIRASDDIMPTKLVEVDIVAETIEAAYGLLGAYNKQDIHQYISSSGCLTYEAILNARDSLKAVEMLLEAPKDGVSQEELTIIRNAHKQYLCCLESWATGAELNNMAEDICSKVVDGKVVTVLEKALAVQSDNGCVTGLVRLNNGAIVLFHNEEESQFAYSNNRRHEGVVTTYSQDPTVVSIKVNNQPAVKFFNYPHLIHGGWLICNEEKYAQAADFLYGETGIDVGTTANEATALLGFIRNKVDPAKVLKQIGPFIDGYSISIASSVDCNVKGKQIVYQGEYVVSRDLPETPGASFVTSNMLLDENFAKEVRRAYYNSKPKEVTSEADGLTDDEWYDLRNRKGGKLVSKITNSPFVNEFEAFKAFLRLMSFRSGEYSYASAYTHAFFVTLISESDFKTYGGANILSKPTAMAIKNARSYNDINNLPLNVL